MPLLIPIGGFLGAGKTSLLAAAANLLKSRSTPAAAITNDQADNLVDTAFLRAADIPVAEVSGGCFCCRFEDLEHAATAIAREAKPHALLAEPVGSCTDLASTVVRPWRQLLARASAPISVLIDSHRLAQAINPSAPGPLTPEAAYILHKQLEEADVIVLSKIDTLDRAEIDRAASSLRAAFPGRHIFTVSAVTGAGVDGWLDHVLSKDAALSAGQRRIDVDYDTYAKGEAALGWLNARGTALVGSGGGAALALEATRRLQAAFNTRSSSIAHVKVRIENDQDAAQAHAVSNDAAPSAQGDCPAGRARLTLNARVQTDPHALEYITRETLAGLAPAGAHLDQLTCFSPARPVPRHRM